MAKKKHEPKCDCLFCKSKCPECGSGAINVKLKVEYEYSNDSIDHISVYQNEDSIELECEDCGTEFFEHDPRLNPLKRALYRYLDLPGNKSFDIEEGKIKSCQTGLVNETA